MERKHDKGLIETPMIVCKSCEKTLVTIELEAKLAASEQALAAEKERREQAETQAAIMREEFEKITKLHQGREMSYPFVVAQKIAMDVLTGQTVTLRKNALLAEHKRYREALEQLSEYQFGWDYTGAARAALNKEESK